MKLQHKSLLLLLKGALTGERFIFDESFDLAQAQAIAEKHNVLTLFYYGVKTAGLKWEESMAKDAVEYIGKSIVVDECQNFEAKRIFDAFSENGIDYMPIKGIGLKRIYPKPEMRAMGDVDVLIRVEQYERIKQIMTELEFVEVDESDHEFIWSRGNVCIELHKRLIPSYNKDYYRCLGDGWSLAKEKRKHEFQMMLEDEFVYMFLHFTKHYRDSGIGIKHMIDLWLFLQKYPKLDTASLQTKLSRLRIYEFYVNVLKTLSVWFDGAVGDSKTEFISEMIFQSGVFGTKKTHILSLALKDAKSNKTIKKIRFEKFKSSVLVSYEFLCKKYPIVAKLPFLAPFAWLFYLVKKLFQKDKLKEYRSDFKLIDKEKIDEYQAALSYVGLDFDYEE